MSSFATYICSIYNLSYSVYFFFFFFNDTATTEIYTLSLHDALPILTVAPPVPGARSTARLSNGRRAPDRAIRVRARSEEHTSELQSQSNLVCRLLLEKKKTTNNNITHNMSSTFTDLSQAQTVTS